MLKNKNIYLSNGTYYETAPSEGATVVGAYQSS
jgi:hypothetical protein